VGGTQTSDSGRMVIFFSFKNQRYMYENRKMRPVETIPGMGKGG
jgi:hypothetical protein